MLLTPAGIYLFMYASFYAAVYLPNVVKQLASIFLGHGSAGEVTNSTKIYSIHLHSTFRVRLCNGRIPY